MISAGTGVLEHIAVFLLSIRVPSPLLWPFILFSFNYVPIVAMILCLRTFLRARRELLTQIEQFSVSDAQCFDPQDKEYVSDLIIILYGSLEAFNSFARSELRSKINKRFDPLSNIPYWMLVRIFCPQVVAVALELGFGMAPSMSLSYRLHFATGWCILIWLQLPLIIKGIEWVIWFRLHTGMLAEEIVVSMVQGVACTAVVSMWSMIWFLFLGESVLPKVVSVVLCCILLGQCWRSALLRWRPRHWSRRTSGVPLERLSVRVRDFEPFASRDDGPVADQAQNLGDTDDCQST
jgi:hypothetical protein